MGKRIFLIDDAGALRPMAEGSFANEDLFQSLLEQHPDLMCADGEPRRWLLVKREMGLADREDGSGRWSVDHLFLDAEAVPTLVEVKRSSDSRIRREVVGQMLDYAANAVLYWPIEKLRSDFEQRCAKGKVDPIEQIMAVLGADSASPEERESRVEAFWEQVKTNLEAQRIRLVFVADDVPVELQRIVEFLNGQMEPAEVLAIQLKPFEAEGFRTLVPRTFGYSAKSDRRKPTSRGPGKQWDEASFMDEVRRRGDEQDVATAYDLIEWIRHTGEEDWKNGRVVGGVELKVQVGDQAFSPFALYTVPKFSVSMWGLRDIPKLQDLLTDFCHRLNEVPGLELPAVDTFWHREFPLKALADPAHRRQLKASYEWFIPELRRQLS